MHIQEEEDRDYEEGCRYTAWLIAKWEGMQAGPVRGEDGWTPEWQAEVDAVRRQLYGE